jgi:hypothetical protein
MTGLPLTFVAGKQFVKYFLKLPLIIQKCHLSHCKNIFLTCHQIRNAILARLLGKNCLQFTASYFEINGIMCCIVLKSLYLCVVKGKEGQKVW